MSARTAASIYYLFGAPYTPTSGGFRGGIRVGVWKSRSGQGAHPSPPAHPIFLFKAYWWNTDFSASRKEVIIISTQSAERLVKQTPSTEYFSAGIVVGHVMAANCSLFCCKICSPQALFLLREDCYVRGLIVQKASQPPFVTMPRRQKQKGRPLSTYTVPPIKLFFQHSLISFSSSQHLHRHLLCCYSQVQSPLLHNCCHQIQQLHCPLSPSSHALPCYKQIGLLCCYCVKPDRREVTVYNTGFNCVGGTGEQLGASAHPIRNLHACYLSFDLCIAICI
ncbi:uncharacterized protein LOC120669979 isoform X3 [Panicum virgatum]|uniref:uncharacterized protein LOC120669979 isoform X3 n=1 Tax=Panicum virgatum TaxID=38727 RepID=UPI0019D5E156|nr:uncharacterized protein LOC120669979 isoform X3 [Panicum virgatum]